MTKSALLIGCNYPGTKNELRGCVNDVFDIKQILVDYLGFDESNIVIMVDTDGKYMQPTGRDIRAQIKKMVAEAKDGDMLVLLLSGHGMQIPNKFKKKEEDGKCESYVPTDMDTIVDVDFHMMVKPLQEKNVKLTILADCCHSENLLDHGQAIITGPKAVTSQACKAKDMSMKEMVCALEESEDGQDFKNRAIPFEEYMEMVSEKLHRHGAVDVASLRASLINLYGSDISALFEDYLKAIESYNDRSEVQRAQVNQVAPTVDGVPSTLNSINKSQQQNARSLNLIYNLFVKETEDKLSRPPAGIMNPGPYLQALLEDQKGFLFEYMMDRIRLVHESDYRYEQGLIKWGEKLPEGANAGPATDNRVGIFLSACMEGECAADSRPAKGSQIPPHGAFTFALTGLIRQLHKEGKSVTNRDLVLRVRENRGCKFQSPCLECEERWADTPFVVRDQ